MTPEEIAALRRMATTGGLVSLTGKELSTILLERDHHAAEAKALREAAEALVDELSRPGDSGSSIAVCHCGALATAAHFVGHPGETERLESYCDECVGHNLVSDLPHAAPLRALRALLGRTP